MANPRCTTNCKHSRIPRLRDYLKLDKAVRRNGGSPCGTRPTPSYPLKEWDVLDSHRRHPHRQSGMVRLDKDLRVSFGYRDSAAGEKWQVAADSGAAPGKLCRSELPVSPVEHPTLVSDLQGSYPSYFVYGPLVFSTATWQFLSSIGGNAGMMRMLGFVKSPLVTRASRSSGFRCSRNSSSFLRHFSRTNSRMVIPIRPVSVVLL